MAGENDGKENGGKEGRERKWRERRAGKKIENNMHKIRYIKLLKLRCIRNNMHKIRYIK